MSIDAAIVDVLRTNAGVSALVGDRIQPVFATDQALPALTYQKISGPREHTLDGPIGMASPRYQIDCWSFSHRQTAELADAVRKALGGYQGQNAGTRILQTLVDDERDDAESEREPKKSERRLWRRSLDFIIWHDE